MKIPHRTWQGLVAGVAAALALLTGVLAPAGATVPLPAAAASSTTRPTAAASSGKARYVVLGDSVSYGFGLANPGRTRQGALAPGQGPSSRAWPSLVDAKLSGFAPLRQRPTACGLTSPGQPYDNLAVSGAPSIRNRWTGTNSDCTTAAGAAIAQQAVSPTELSAARLHADQPALVTVQVGADDIDFAGCLSALLGLPASAGAVPCVTSTAHGLGLPARTEAELASLGRGLTTIIRTIHSAAPHARIVVLDYYQIVPTAAATVTGSTPLCTDIALQSAIPGWRLSFRAKAAFALAHLDATITAATRKFPDVSLVDLSTAFAGHELCTPQTWLFSTTWDAAHPTAVGQQHIAAAVLADCRTLAKKCRGR
jgi:lysophospholipase L1-like esterase